MSQLDPIGWAVNRRQHIERLSETYQSEVNDLTLAQAQAIQKVVHITKRREEAIRRLRAVQERTGKVTRRD